MSAWLKCPNCGHQVGTEGRFCPSCGADLSKRPASAETSHASNRSTIQIQQEVGSIGGGRVEGVHIENAEGPLSVVIQTQPSPEPLDLLWESHLAEELFSGPREFLGREAELAIYRGQLKQYHYTILKGMPGIGKTTMGQQLALELAQQGYKVFWFSFDLEQQNTVEDMFVDLARFVKTHGGDRASYLGQAIEFEMRSRRSVGWSRKLEAMLRDLASGRYVLCFDDFHNVKDSRDVELVFEKLKGKFEGHWHNMPAPLILMGRELPQVLEELVEDSLKGLGESDALIYLSKWIPHIPTDLAQELWQRTEGNPKLLSLAASTIHNKLLASKPEELKQFLNNLAGASSVRDYLMVEIFRDLKPPERKVMGAISIFPRAVEREVLEVVLEAEGIVGIPAILYDLENKSLLGQDTHDRLQCHGLIREFVARHLDRSARLKHHRRAAQHYGQRNLYLPCAHHLILCEEVAEATHLLTAHADPIIHSGQAGALFEQLDRINTLDSSLKVLSAEQRVEINLVLGDIHHLRGSYSEAARAYQVAIDICNDDAIKANLLSKTGRVCEAIGKLADAANFHQQSLSHAQSSGNPMLVANAYQALGFVLTRLHKYSEAQNALDAAYSIAESESDQPMLAKVYQGLAALYRTQGQFEQSIKFFELALPLFRQTKDAIKEAQILTGLGMAYSEIKDTIRGDEAYQSAISLQQKIGDSYGLQSTYSNAGYLSLQVNDFPKAIEYFQRMRKMARESGNVFMESRANISLAEAYLLMPPENYLSQDKYQEAEQCAQLAVAITQESNLINELGMAYGILAEKHLMTDNIEQSKHYLGLAQPLLERGNDTAELTKIQKLGEQLALLQAREREI